MGHVDGGPAALLFTFSKQPFHTVLRLAHSTGRGILNLVAAIAVCLAPWAVSGAAPSAARRRLQPAPGQLLGRRLYLLLELLLYRGFFFYRFNGVSPPAKRGQGPGGPRPFYIIPPHLLRRLRTHEPVEVILGEMVHKGHDGAAALDEPPAKVHIGDVGKLVVRDIEQAGQLCPVCARWLSMTRNSLLASMVRAVWDWSRSSTFWVRPVQQAPYFRTRSRG